MHENCSCEFLPCHLFYSLTHSTAATSEQPISWANPLWKPSAQLLVRFMCLASPESVPSAGWKLGISNFSRRPLTIDPGSLEVEQEGVQLFPNINRHRINQRLEGVNNTIIIEFIINVLKIHVYFLFFHPLNSLIDAAILVLQYSSNYKLNNNSLNEVPSYRPDSTKSLLSQRLSSYRLPSHRLPSQRLSS